MQKDRDDAAFGEVTRPPAVWSSFGLLLLIGLVCYREWSFSVSWADGLLRMWHDTRVYVYALRAWNAGVDPYSVPYMGLLHFVYPPVVFYMMNPVRHLLVSPTGIASYLMLQGIACVSVPLILARYFLKLSWLSGLFAVALFFTEPQMAGAFALGTGNISMILYSLLLIAALLGMHRKRWTPYYLVVFVATVIKAQFVLFLLLPLMLSGLWVGGAVCSVALVAAYGAQMKYMPTLYAGYKEGLRAQLLEVHEFGYGFLGIFSAVETKFRNTVGVGALFATAVITILVLALFWRTRGRVSELGINRESLALLTVILIYPRMMHYDACIALVISFAVFVQYFKIRRPEWLAIALYVPTWILPYVVKNFQIRGIYQLILMTVAFGLVARSFRKGHPAEMESFFAGRVAPEAAEEAGAMVPEEQPAVVVFLSTVAARE